MSHTAVWDRAVVALTRALCAERLHQSPSMRSEFHCGVSVAGSRLAARSRGRDAVASHGRGAGAVPFGFALQQSTHRTGRGASWRHAPRPRPGTARMARCRGNGQRTVHLRTGLDPIIWSRSCPCGLESTSTRYGSRTPAPCRAWRAHAPGTGSTFGRRRVRYTVVPSQNRA